MSHKTNYKELKERAIKKYEEEYNVKPIQRLEFLLDRTSMYSKFLSEKINLEINNKNPALDVEPEETYTFKQPKLIENAIVKDYQLKGIQWLVSLFENGLNGILADEMGLGKTIQAIGLIAHLIEKGVKGPYLIVAPLSALSNWAFELDKFVPSIKVMMYYGNKEERSLIRTRKFKENISVPIVLTSYEVVKNDRKHLQKHEWKYIVIDEGHRLKNINCKLVEELRKYKCLNKLLLTGTPLQNDIKELFSLLNFILPKIFDDLDSFEEWFDFSDLKSQQGYEKIIENEESNKIVSKLHHILNPFILRRLKVDVEQDLPPKREYILYTKLTERQKELYKMLVEKDCRKGELASEKNEFSLMNIMVQLRKVCNHPYLIFDKVDSEAYLHENLVNSSGKLIVLDQLLDRLLPAKHKVLVFSQMTKALNILEIYLNNKNIQFCRIDGSLSQENRRDQIRKFKNNTEYKVFLLSTRAGGLGINLTSADTVIIFDSDWNPQMDLQAQDRCHRIGQKSPVVVYRFITANSVEEKILDNANFKRKLEKLVIYHDRFNKTKKIKVQDEEHSENFANQISKLLNSKDYQKLLSDQLSAKLSPEVLDKIVDRSLESYAKHKDDINPIYKPYESPAAITCDQNLKFDPFDSNK